MNLLGDNRYTTPGEYAAFTDDRSTARRERVAHEAADDRAHEALEAHEEPRIVVDGGDRSDQHTRERTEERGERERQRAGQVGRHPA